MLFKYLYSLFKLMIKLMILLIIIILTIKSINWKKNILIDFSNVKGVDSFNT